MGEYAEMMLDGTCCSQCGEFIDTGNGFATLCAGCAGEQPDLPPPSRRKRPQRYPCPHCDQKLRTPAGVQQHIAAKHGNHQR